MSVDNTSENKDTVIVKRKVKLVLSKSDDFQDVRCDCGALLFRELKKSDTDARTVEIKCRRCGKISRH